MPTEQFDTRTAPKFVMRCSSAMLEAISMLGKVNGRSANSEIQVGLEAWLNGVAKTEYRIAICENYLGKARADKVIESVKRTDISEAAGKSKFVIRLKPSMREAIAGVSERSKEDGQARSQHFIILTALNWWINTTKVLEALENACQEAALSKAA
jgi:hypothetical protein